MTLSVALNTARSSLQSTSAQISVSGRNIAGANDPGYSRKIALTSTTGDGSARVSVGRATDLALFFHMLGATSSAASQKALLEGLDRLSATLGDPEQGQSPAALTGTLANALQQHANAPDDTSLARGVVTAAEDLTSALHDAQQTVLDVRSAADADMAGSVGTINDLLGKFGGLNRAVVEGTASGVDITDALDQRDALLSKLSEEIGISVMGRSNNDIAIYTDSGVPLFDGRARTVTFQPTPLYAPGMVGHAVFADGVPVTGEAATMSLRSGQLVGLVSLRDAAATTYQRQLDEIARGLVSSFAESDQTGSSLPDAAGLFTDGSSAAVPATSANAVGLAGRIRVSPAVDPAEGGRLDRLRDGGINGSSYRYSATGAAASAGWLEGTRQAASKSADYQSAVLSRASDSLSNATGVNLDDEYAAQLELERSFAASSKLIGVIGQLYDSLFQAVR